MAGASSLDGPKLWQGPPARAVRSATSWALRAGRPLGRGCRLGWRRAVRTPHQLVLVGAFAPQALFGPVGVVRAFGELRSLRSLRNSLRT